MLINEMRLTGYAGRNAETKVSKAGKHYVMFSLPDTIKGKNGEPDQTTWFNVMCFENESVGSKITTNTAAHINKGDLVYVEGRLSVRVYIDKNGNPKDDTKIIAKNVGILVKQPRGEPSINPCYTPPSYDIGEIPF